MAQNITPESLISILAAALAQKPTKPLVLALDGRCGSGKTTLANTLARQFPARDRKSTRLNSSHNRESRMPSSA